jgi:hypothetical protein
MASSQRFQTHIRAAEAAIIKLDEVTTETPIEEVTLVVNLAQVHATIALAAATQDKAEELRTIRQIMNRKHRG